MTKGFGVMAKKKKVSKKKKAVDKPTICEGNFASANDGQNGNRVFIAVGKTINMGNYESVRVEVGQGCTVDDGDYDCAKERCIAEVTKTLNELTELVDSGKIC